MSKSTIETRSCSDLHDRVIQCWIDMGVPTRIAEVAAIDMYSHVSIASKQNQLAAQTIASMLYGDVAKHYTNSNDQWHRHAFQTTKGTGVSNAIKSYYYCGDGIDHFNVLSQHAFA